MSELEKTGGAMRTIVETIADEIERIDGELERLDKVVRVADRAARDTIPTADRYEGLWVEVLGEAKVYRLTDGLTNDHWQERVGMSAVGVPVASADQYGVVKIGSGIDRAEDGVISVPDVDIATSTVAGLAKGGGNITIAADGTLSVPDVVDMISRGFGRKQTVSLSTTTIPPNDFDQLWDVNRIAGIQSTGQLNGPGLGNGILFCYGLNSVYRVQLFLSYGGRMAIRAKSNGTLFDWVEIANGYYGYSPNRLEVITASKTWTAPKTCFVQVTCVGGGGGGGGSGRSGFSYCAGGGGGGCGKIVEGFLKVTKGQTIAAVIGAGGAGGAGGDATANGSAGGKTSFGSISAAGGNGGGRSTAANSPGVGGVGGEGGTLTITVASSNGFPSTTHSGIGGNGGLNYKIRNGSTWFGGGGRGGNANSAGSAGTAGAIELRY